MVYTLSLFKNIEAIRIHVSGDFYSQEYFDNWCEIIKKHNDKTFYSYTKNFKLNLTNKPDNLTLIVSDDLKEFDDALIQNNGFDGYARIKEHHEDLTKNETLCPYEQGIGCGPDCNLCYNKHKPKQIIFHKH